MFDPVLCKSKQFYEFLITKKGKVSRVFTKLKNDFDLDDITVSRFFSICCQFHRKLLLEAFS